MSRSTPTPFSFNLFMLFCVRESQAVERRDRVGRVDGGVPTQNASLLWSEQFYVTFMVVETCVSYACLFR